MTITVQHKVPVTVESSEIKLPFYFSSGNLAKSICCITAEFVVIDMHVNGTYGTLDTQRYDCAEDVADRLEREFCNVNFQEIDASVFMHKFSEFHRELFYLVNPELKPNA